MTRLRMFDGLSGLPTRFGKTKPVVRPARNSFRRAATSGELSTKRTEFAVFSSGVSCLPFAFYRVAFDSTYKGDLEAVGHGQVWPHLAQIQERRNLFAHGQPQAIDDALVQIVVERLKVEHEAWIAVFNKRAARLQ